MYYKYKIIYVCFDQALWKIVNLLSRNINWDNQNYVKMSLVCIFFKFSLDLIHFHKSFSNLEICPIRIYLFSIILI